MSALSCGGGGGSGSSAPPAGASGGPPPSGSNVIGLVVDAGPTSTSPDVNMLFATVTLCVPGDTAGCQTIDHIQVDTGSYGLRVLAPVLTLNLPVQKAANGDSLLECVQFVDGYSWGPVVLADVQISGETAGSVPVQVIGDSRFPHIPPGCSGTGTAQDTVATFGANGILGVGVFAQDCGSGCAGTVENGTYYACSGGQCRAATAALSSQVVNPITLFAKDNNGVIIQLPSVASQGAATVTGTMIFGIDTQANNKSGGQSIFTLDPRNGYLTTVFNGQSLTQSFVDTGSNAFFFNDAGIAKCANGKFYCPPDMLNLTATLQGQNALSAEISFSVANADTLFAMGVAALPTLAGPYPATTTVDWGLPFYFGRTVYTAVVNATTYLGPGPYVAF